MVTIIFLCLLFSPFVVRSKCKNRRSRKARYTVANAFADASKTRSVSCCNRQNLTNGKTIKAPSATDLEKEEHKRQAELEKQIKRRQAEYEKAQREHEKAERAREKAIKEERKRQEAAAKLAYERRLASSDLQYIEHRIEQLENLVAYYEDKQEGTLANGKEFFKYEQSIMRCQKELQALAHKQIKLRYVLGIS